mmetsp:Transcript_6501/g.10129  ORF Transcript_6501/g.10129 Transcript_6501/m.10129 type:complete len:243 (+) Transcript_6501:103-831(+)
MEHHHHLHMLDRLLDNSQTDSSGVVILNPDEGSSSKQSRSRTNLQSPYGVSLWQMMVLGMSLLLAMTMIPVVVADAAVDQTGKDRFQENEDAMRLAREQAKPWLMRELEWNGTKLYVTPTTIIVVLVFLVNLCSWFLYTTSGTWAEASHILVKDTSKKTHKALVGMQQDIAGNLKLFGELAEKYSQCPSSKEKGDLGRFSQGTMAPPFDKAVFDPKTPLKTTIGPIQTQFGYHLIFIRNRKL